MTEGSWDGSIVGNDDGTGVMVTGVHISAPSWDVYPWLHAKHSEDDAIEYLPTEQSKHEFTVDAPTEFDIRPEGHEVQPVAPDSE